MQISSIQPTAKFSADLANGQHIELEVEFIAMDEVADFIKPGESFRLSKLLRKLIIGAVTGWNLANPDGSDILLTEENKAKYLPIILGLPVKPVGDEKTGETFVRAVLNFATNSENFLKN